MKTVNFKIVNVDKLNTFESYAVIKLAFNPEATKITSEKQGFAATLSIDVEQLTLIQRQQLVLLLNSPKKVMHEYSEEQINSIIV